MGFLITVMKNDRIYIKIKSCFNGMFLFVSKFEIATESECLFE